VNHNYYVYILSSANGVLYVGKAALIELRNPQWVDLYPGLPGSRAPGLPGWRPPARPG
jgi:hypothetical protein